MPFSILLFTGDGNVCLFRPRFRTELWCHLLRLRLNQALWRGLVDGTIDIVVSGHAPHSKYEKNEGKEDIWKAPPGTPGVETRLLLMLTEVFNKRLSLLEVVRLCSTKPAEIFGLYPRKGTILVGSDADFVIVDLQRKWTLKRDELETKARDTFLFDKWNVRGKCVATFVRGKLVMKDGLIVGTPGDGQFIRAEETNPIHI